MVANLQRIRILMMSVIPGHGLGARKTLKTLKTPGTLERQEHKNAKNS